MAARDLCFLRDLLVEFAITLDGPSLIATDSKSAVDMAFDPVAFKQTKHILRAAYFLRDLTARLVVALQHTPGRVMVADLLTKPVARPVYVALMRLVAGYSTSGVVCPT